MHCTRRTLFAIAASLLLLTSVGTARADGESIYPDYAAPAYAIMSLTPTFEFELVPPVEGDALVPVGSPTILVPIGVFQGGTTVRTSQFFRQAPSTIPLPEDAQYLALQGNAITIVGSFETSGNATAHMVTPLGGTIPQDIQRAFYEASRDGSLDGLVSTGEVAYFPTTAEISGVVTSHLPEGSSYSISDVEGVIFGSTMTLALTVSGVSVAAEDDLFPHPDDSPSLFHAGLDVDEDGNFDVDVCTLVDVKVSEESINLKKKGRLPVVVYTTEDFDAADVDVTTVEMGGVLAVTTALEDADGDGDLDLVCHFEVPDLKDAGVLTTSTTSVTLRADLLNGSCVYGTSSVNVKK